MVVPLQRLWDTALAVRNCFVFLHQWNYVDVHCISFHAEYWQMAGIFSAFRHYKLLSEERDGILIFLFPESGLPGLA